MLTTLYVARHAHRMNHSEFRSEQASVPRDPPLTARGEEQIHDLAAFFARMPADEQPQLIICSPYTRCVRTALPIHEKLGLELCIEPGLAEWFGPVWPKDTGLHPSPRTAEHLVPQFPTVSTRWKPLLYPDPRGESIPGVHERMRELMRRINERCSAWGLTRILLVSHAATIIALGRMLQAQGTYESVREKEIRAGTASVSKYTRPHVHAQIWHQEYNGRTSFLPHGEERHWDFSFVPDNNTEPGMGVHWHDVYAPQDHQLIFYPKL